MAANLSIGFLGAGKMATALANGFLRAGLVSPGEVLAADPSPEARKAFTSETGAKATVSNPEVVKAVKVVILAVKPDQVFAVLGGIRSALTDKHLLLSIAAGITLPRLEAALEPGARVVRVMPNTPALVGSSASAFAVGDSTLPQDAELTHKLLSSVGVAFQVTEPLLDAVTGLSGSGPAYAYVMIEALSDGGVAAGLPRSMATKLAAQTVLGAARMVLESGLHPAQLKDMVASPGGTTIEGLHALEQGGVRGAFISAVRAAADKAKRLG